MNSAGIAFVPGVCREQHKTDSADTQRWGRKPAEAVITHMAINFDNEQTHFPHLTGLGVYKGPLKKHECRILLFKAN